MASIETRNQTSGSVWLLRFRVWIKERKYEHLLFSHKFVSIWVQRWGATTLNETFKALADVLEGESFLYPLLFYSPFLNRLLFKLLKNHCIPIKPFLILKSILHQINMQSCPVSDIALSMQSSCCTALTRSNKNGQKGFWPFHPTSLQKFGNPQIIPESSCDTHLPAVKQCPLNLDDPNWYYIFHAYFTMHGSWNFKGKKYYCMLPHFIVSSCWIGKTHWRHLN